MINEIITKWENNKKNLQGWFAKNHPIDYQQIVTKLFELVINIPFFKWDIGKMVILDTGGYQGDQIYLIQSMDGPWMVTHNKYGSCSGCDTLEAICDRDDRKAGPPLKHHVEGYMTLALHLVQKMRWITD